jgi:hypothetical protein
MSKKINYEIMKCLVVSTSHISMEDDKKLTNHETGVEIVVIIGSLIVDTSPFGHRIHVDYSPKWVDSLKKDFSEGFIQLLELAIELEVDEISIDSDGPTYPNLPVYDW